MDYQLVQTYFDQNVTIQDYDMKNIFMFTFTPNSSEICDNVTMGLYEDENLTILYKTPDVNATVELISTVVNGTYTA